MNNAAGSLSIGALLARGDDLAAAGDSRAAVSFYQAALADARQARSLDPPTMERLRRAQAFIQARVQDFQQALDHALADIHSDDPVAAVRLHHALDLLKGKRTIYPQQPSMLYYPYLAQRQFFEREEFPWAAELEGKTEAIRAELLALLQADADFRPYVESNPDRPARDFHGLNDNPNWTALYLWKHGAFVPQSGGTVPGNHQGTRECPAIADRNPDSVGLLLAPRARSAHPAAHGNA